MLGAAVAVTAIGWWAYETRSAPAAPVSAPKREPPNTGTRPPAADASFVGSAACRSCHAAEWSKWSASQHAHAMHEATPEHVLAQPAARAAARSERGVQARFFREQAALHVETEGPSGQREAYEVAFTFGVAPLQQYLVRFPGGRLQALPVAWDSRDRASGGERWFQLYPDVLDHRDQLHWTGPYQNWNMMCAECHVTGYVKAYDAQHDLYASSWSEIGVGCESCHGPASAHLAWAGNPGAAGSAARGFLRRPSARAEFRFATPDAPIASSVRPPDRDASAECAACHARAGSIDDRQRLDPRLALTQHHRPALLVPPEYWPTGEQHDEVFVWGSFAASKMAAHGVTCGDCHEPHSGAPLAQGNALCARCHQPAVFDAPAHHRHAPESAGAQCVECHMANERFMRIDERRDHSFQLPRPDLTLETKSPNACNRCHAQQTPEWAARTLDAWYGQRWRTRPHWATAFALAEQGSSAARRPLAALVRDPGAPAIVRASALRLLRHVPRATPDPALLALVDDAQPLVRAEALQLLELVEPAERWRRAQAHLGDEDRLVRLAAADLLCGLSPDITGGAGAERLRVAVAALTRSLEQQADFAANATQLGHLYLRQADLVRVRSWLAHALARDPQFAGSYLAVSELERVAGDQAASARALEAGIARLPAAANLQHASGLALVRLGKKPEAIARLARAVELAPDDAGFAYTYAVALQDRGEQARAVQVLERALREQPENGELLEELLRLAIQTHDGALLARHVPTFERLFPEDASIPLLYAALKQR
jgi:tetratricopeptide (TPR) repeat protein